MSTETSSLTSTNTTSVEISAIYSALSDVNVHLLKVRNTPAGAIYSAEINGDLTFFKTNSN
jgi:hypothetical protein